MKKISSSNQRNNDGDNYDRKVRNGTDPPCNNSGPISQQQQRCGSRSIHSTIRLENPDTRMIMRCLVCLMVLGMTSIQLWVSMRYAVPSQSNNSESATLFGMISPPSSIAWWMESPSLSLERTWNSNHDDSQQQQQQSPSQQNDQSPPKGRIYLEGYNQNVQQFLFPDYIYNYTSVDGSKYVKPGWKEINDTVVAATTRDILVHGDPLNRRALESIIHFPGKILFVNGESRGSVFQNIPREMWNSLDVANRIYQIGPYDVTKTSSTSYSNDDVISKMKNNNKDSNTNSNRVIQLKTFQNIRDQVQERNSDQHFFFTTVMGAQMMWELAAAAAAATKSSTNDGVTTTSNSNTFTGPLPSDFDNTRIWKSLTDPTQRPRNSGTYRAVAFFQSNCASHRMKAATAISEIVQIHHGKRCRINSSKSATTTSTTSGNNNNNGRTFGASLRDTSIDHWTKNLQLLSEYKYCLVMENTQKNNYMTEKLLNALLAGCLPIYFGLPNIHEIVNPSAFILYDPNHPQPALDLIERLERNDTLYDEMISAPIFGRSSRHESMSTAEIDQMTMIINKYFSFHPSLGDGSVYRRVRHMMGIET